MTKGTGRSGGIPGAVSSLENVAIPYTAACQVIGVFSYREARSAHPRCVVGLTDLSARQFLRAQAGKDMVSFTIPFQRFLEMDPNIEGSLEQEPWLALK
jgi:hypothetical protein